MATREDESKLPSVARHIKCHNFTSFRRCAPIVIMITCRKMFTQLCFVWFFPLCDRIVVDKLTIASALPPHFLCTIDHVTRSGLSDWSGCSLYKLYRPC